MGLPGSDSGGHFRPSTHYLRPTLAFRRARQASDPAELIEVEGQDFFSGSAAVAAGHLVSADPVERVGSWKKRGRDSRSSVKRCFQEKLGGGGLASRSDTCATGASAGGCAIRCSPHAPRRFPRGWEAQGSPRVRLRAARRVFGIPGSDFGCRFRPSKHYFRYTFASSERSTSLGSSKVDRC